MNLTPEFDDGIDQRGRFRRDDLEVIDFTIRCGSNAEDDRTCTKG